MTAPQNPRVTQADWDAAQSLCASGWTHAIQAFARHREAAEAASKARTLSDHGRMLWRDDVEGHCPSPELCFEYGPTVRCSPCAIAQAEAAGVATLRPDHTYSPQECRLKRELAASKAREAALAEALEGAIPALEQDYEQAQEYGDADWEGLAYQRLHAARAALTKEPDA